MSVISWLTDIEVSDLWHLTAILFHNYGDGAEMYERLKADEALDNQSCAIWKRVAIAVSDLEQRGSVHGLH